MRVTNSMILRNFNINISRNLEKISNYQNQLSTGKEINKPSDNPLLATRSMALRSSLEQNGQFKKNIEDSIDWLDMTDSSLDSMTGSLHRIKELVVYGSNGTLGETDKNSIKMEVEEMMEEFKVVVNGKYDGRYIFGGSNIDSPPFTKDTGVLNYVGDDITQKIEISENALAEINITGDKIFNTSEGNIGEIFSDTLDGLATGDKEKLSDSLGKLDNYLEQILAVRGEVGSKTNRLEAALERNEQQELDLTELLSKTEDIDYAKKIMEYTNMETIYRASLSTGSKVIQPTLLDFLR